MLDKDKLPQHIAIILDGNGRYAKKRFLPRQVGHKKGADTLKTIVEYSNEIGIKYLTVYAFSTENWNREQSEVNYLMDLLVNYLDTFLKDFRNSNIKIDFIGDMTRLSDNILNKMEEVKDVTKDATGLYFSIAINYGSRDEIKRAVKAISTDVANNVINVDEIDESLISSYLDTKNIPNPDLLIRTSNELRISNFLLWQISYSELYFSEKLWPEFTKDDLNEALNNFARRERRYGGRKS